MMCGTQLFPITFDLAQLMLRQVRVCPNGYGAMNGHAETNVHQRQVGDVLHVGSVKHADQYPTTS